MEAPTPAAKEVKRKVGHKHENKIMISVNTSIWKWANMHICIYTPFLYMYMFYIYIYIRNICICIYYIRYPGPKTYPVGPTQLALDSRFPGIFFQHLKISLQIPGACLLPDRMSSQADQKGDQKLSFLEDASGRKSLHNLGSRRLCPCDGFLTWRRQFAFS